MSSNVRPLTISRAFGALDLLVSALALLYPGLFAELIYPTLTPHGVVFAVTLIGWGRFGRGLCALLSPPASAHLITAWLWLATLPAHIAGAWRFGSEHGVSLSWHLSHLILVAIASGSIALRSTPDQS